MPNPTTNADNLPPIPLTEEQQFLFDTRGWLLFPGILSESEVKEMREFCPPGATNYSWGESLTAFVSGATATTSTPQIS